MKKSNLKYKSAFATSLVKDVREFFRVPKGTNHLVVEEDVVEVSFIPKPGLVLVIAYRLTAKQGAEQQLVLIRTRVENENLVLTPQQLRLVVQEKGVI